MDVGAALREARLQAGLSREQVSNATKIQLAKIEALEANAFERLPEGIYLDGIVRAYAREVGVDGNALVAALPVLERRYVPPVESAPPEPPPAVPYTDPELYDEPELYIQEHGAPAFLAAAPPSRGVARFAVPLIALLIAIGVGAYLYQTSRPFPTAAERAVPAVSHDNAAIARERGDATVAAANPDSTESVTRAVSSSDAREESPPASSETTSPAEAVSRPSPPTAATSSTVPTSPAAATSSTEPASPAAHHDSRPLDRAPDVPVAPVAPAAVAAPVAAAPGESVAPAAPSASAAGHWTLNTRVETSSYRNFEGLELGYRLELIQDGNRISGQGVKTVENGQSLAGAAQTPIHVQGKIDGNRMTLTFSEQGTRRESDGKMILDLHEDGVLRGRFSSTAARSTGIVEARRPER
jgi:cytoskeletal protein RodZ